MSEKPTEESKSPEEFTPDPEDTRIIVILERDTSIPKYVDWRGVNPFQLIAIGEWLALKGRQMVLAAEAREAGSATGIVVPTRQDQEVLSRILRPKS